MGIIDFFKQIFSRKQPINTTKKQKKIAFIFGVNEYINPENNLNGCINDCNWMASYLDSSWEKIILYNQKATRNSVLNMLKKCVDAVNLGGGNDILLVFSSHHGTQYVTQSGSISNAIVMHDEVIYNGEFNKILANLKKDKLYIGIRDCCFAAVKSFGTGKVNSKSKAITFATNIPDKGEFSIKNLKSKAIIYSACKGDETSDELCYQYKDGQVECFGRFRKALETALTVNNKISYYDLFLKVKKMVNGGNKHQTPVFYAPLDSVEKYSSYQFLENN